MCLKNILSINLHLNKIIRIFDQYTKLLISLLTGIIKTEKKRPPISQKFAFINIQIQFRMHLIRPTQVPPAQQKKRTTKLLYPKRRHPFVYIPANCARINAFIVVANLDSSIHRVMWRKLNRWKGKRKFLTVCVNSGQHIKAVSNSLLTCPS